MHETSAGLFPWRSSSSALALTVDPLIRPEVEASMNYSDRSLSCVQCGNEFTFTADDQQYHAERGYQEPKRCPSCRAERRASQGGGGSYGSQSYGGGGGGGYDRPRRQMFSATCARCGKEAQVPFEPRGDKPVYCSDCFTPAPRRSSSW